MPPGWTSQARASRRGWTRRPELRTGLLLALLLEAGAAGGAPPPDAPPGPAPGAGVRVALEGELLDPEEKLASALGVVPGKAQAVSEADLQRMQRNLDALGYKVAVKRAGARLVLRLSPYQVIRKIYIKGNWPLFEEEILRQLRFRPGQRLPEGDALEQAIDRQQERLRRFLSREGYFEGHLQIWVEKTSAPNEVDLQVRVLKGRQYKVGSVEVEEVGTTMGAGAAPEDAAAAGSGAEDDGRPQGKGRKKSTAKESEQGSGLVIPRREIERMFHQKLWFYKRTFNTERFQEDVKELQQAFVAKNFPGVRIRESFEVDRDKPASEAVQIKLRIQQRKRILVRYQGNENIKASELDEQLTLSKEGAYDDYEVAQSARKIHKLYQSKGYLQARVHSSRKVGPGTDVVTIVIREGPRLRVKEIRFSGNRSFDEERMGKVIRTRTFPCLGYIGLSGGGYITDLQLKQDAERLEQFYADQGFPDARVRGELAPDPALLGNPGVLAAALDSEIPQRGELYVRFVIDEGDRLMVEGVVISGNRALSDSFLLSRLQLARGKPFTERALALDKARLVRIYSERGYPHAGVSSLEELDEAGNRVMVQLQVQEELAVRFGPVFIRGNFKTRDSVILDDIEFERGDLFDIRKLEEAEQRLRKREIFNVVRVQPLGFSDRRGEVPVLVQVEERYDDWGALELSVGGSTDNKLFGAIAYKNLNLLGFGTQLTLRAEYGWEIWGGNAQYRDPRILGSSFVLDVQALIKNQDTERLGEILTYGGSLTVSRELVPKLTALARYEIRQVKHREDVSRPAGVDESRQVDVLTRTAGFGAALVYDGRDNPLSPTRGFRVEGSMLWAAPWVGGTDHFLKFNVNGQAFIPLPLDMTIAVNVRYDQGVPLGDRVTLPRVERYYAGGDTTIRGLEEDMALVEAVRIPVMPAGSPTTYHIRPQGGTVRLLTNLEFQFPIWKESFIFGWPLMGALFVDNGVVTNSLERFGADFWRHGAGAALRLVTPVGFTSIAYAFCLDPEEWDPKLGRFHFNFGYVF